MLQSYKKKQYKQEKQNLFVQIITFSSYISTI